jgi:hypothetical protein
MHGVLIARLSALSDYLADPYKAGAQTPPDMQATVDEARSMIEQMKTPLVQAIDARAAAEERASRAIKGYDNAVAELAAFKASPGYKAATEGAASAGPRYPDLSAELESEQTTLALTLTLVARLLARQGIT